MDAVPFPKWQQYAITATPIAPKCVFLGTTTCHKPFGGALSPQIVLTTHARSQPRT
jgi:hypothetical protein